MAVLVDLQHVSVRHSDRVLFEDLALTVSDGDRIGIVGINGTGKSTLLGLIAGVDAPQRGEVRRGRGTRVGYLRQTPVLVGDTVGDAVGGGWEAAAALDRLGMGSSLADEVASLSGGQTKRVALAQILARPVELLVLDEPTNHLDLTGVDWLEQQLSVFRGGLVLVTHDRFLLDRLTNRILELDRGRAFVHDGGYEQYLENRAQREELAATAESTRRNLARNELAWLRRGSKARSRKPKARIGAANRLIEGSAQAPARATGLELAVDMPRLGTKVIECKDVGFRFGAGPVVLSGLDLTLAPGEHVGIVGPNGSGKSTLLDLMAGRRQPSEGIVDVGPTVVVGYYDQHGADLDGEARVQDLVAGPDRAPGSLSDVALMKRFWFTGELPFAKAGSLSGGERRRLQLLVVVAGRPNVLLLDEPTNDLDLDTLRIVEDFVAEWPGTLVVVSHDRTFLDRTTDRLVAIEEDGSAVGVAGGVADWIARSGAAPPAAPNQPESRRRAGSSTAGEPGARSAGGALRAAEKEMARLQRRRDKVAGDLAAAAGHVQMRSLGAELAIAQSALDEAEEHWLRLAEEAESRD